MTNLADINFEAILEDIKPTETEKKRVMELSNELIKNLNETAASIGAQAEAVLVGSVAKSTWLAGKADIDIFMEFSLETEESYLKRCGLKLGHNCIKTMGGTAEERYASHPYVTGSIEGYEVDFVPCYYIEDASQLKSAVDRTILHTQYIKKHLEIEQEDEVLLLKRFMECVGTYGSEFKVGGFSGYLCELMVLEYGSFLGVLEAASTSWRYGQVIDLENYGTAELFKDPMVAVDPVDKNRNVAAALGLQKMSEFVVASSNFLENPSEGYFYPKVMEFDSGSIKEEFTERGTKTFILTFHPPNIPADAVYPQIRKTENSIVKVAEKNGFKVAGSGSWTDEDHQAMILVEFETWNLPRMKKHMGPQIWFKEHQERFLEKYSGKAWVEGDRWVVEVPRTYESVEAFFQGVLLPGEINYLRFGKHIKAEILREHGIVDVKDFLESKCDEEVLRFLHLYLNRNELLCR